MLGGGSVTTELGREEGSEMVELEPKELELEEYSWPVDVPATAVECFPVFPDPEDVGAHIPTQWH